MPQQTDTKTSTQSSTKTLIAVFLGAAGLAAALGFAGSYEFFYAENQEQIIAFNEGDEEIRFVNEELDENFSGAVYNEEPSVFSNGLKINGPVDLRDAQVYKAVNKKMVIAGAAFHDAEKGFGVSVGKGRRDQYRTMLIPYPVENNSDEFVQYFTGIQLPQNATINKITMRGKDNDSNKNMSASLHRTRLTGQSDMDYELADSVAIVFSDGASSDFRQWTDAVNWTVDNDQYTYALSYQSHAKRIDEDPYAYPAVLEAVVIDYTERQ